MPFVPLHESVSYQILFIFFLLVFVVQCFYYWGIFLKLVLYREKAENKKEKGVSVVICARNEHHHLKENLPLILGQDFRDFEVVVVNHASDDDSSFFLTRTAEQDPRLKIVEIRENLNFFTGKKFPLSIGIKSAKYELILLTDADCKPAGKNWITKIAGAFSDETEIVLGYGLYEKKPGLLNSAIRFDTAHIAIQYLSLALFGFPYMGVGRNMAYKKLLFYRNKGFISHYRIDSGDDDLFINRVAQKKNTRISVNPEAFTISEPKIRYRDWILQKKRHLSTGRFYRPVHKMLLGTYSASQFLFYLVFIILVIIGDYMPFILSLVAFRMVSQLFIFSKCMARLKEKGLWFAAPFLEIFFIILNTSLTVSNAFSKPHKWK
jgi:glycosyltransferase involved in cell wall biosynthesis